MADTISVTSEVPPPYSHVRANADMSHDVLPSPDSFSDPTSMNSNNFLGHSSYDNDMALARVVHLERPLTLQEAGVMVPLTIKECSTDSKEHTINGTPGARPRADSITIRDVIRVSNDSSSQFQSFLITIYDKVDEHYWVVKSEAVGSYRLVVALHYVRETLDDRAVQKQQILRLHATNWSDAISIIQSPEIQSVGISALWWPKPGISQAIYEDGEMESESTGTDYEEETERGVDRVRREGEQEAVSLEVDQNSSKSKRLHNSSKVHCCMQ